MTIAAIWNETIVLWTALVVIVLPVTIIAAGEVEERLRQRDSRFRPAAQILRAWVLPLFAAWVVARTLFDVAEDAAGVRIVASLLLLAVAAAALSVMAVVVERLRTRPADRGGGVPRLILALPRLGVLLVTAWVLIAGIWGVDLSAALTALGVTSLVVSFALQDTLSGLASGFLLLADQPFKPGDWIQAGEIEGRVVDVNWRSSRIQNRDGDLVVVPNAELAGGTIVNYDEPDRFHRIVVTVQVAFVNPPTSAKEMLLDAARATPGVLADPPPGVHVTQVDDPLMGYDVHLWIDDYSIAPRVKADFGALVWYQSHRHDVPLPSPAQDLFLYDAARVAEESKPDRALIRQRLLASPLLAELDDSELDHLAAGTRPDRFRAGEVIVGPDSPGRDLYLLDEGHARIVVDDLDGQPVDVTDVASGELFRALTRERSTGAPPLIVAVTDCEILRIGEAVAIDVANRNPEVLEAVNGLLRSRQRRLERMLSGRVPELPAAGGTDDG